MEKDEQKQSGETERLRAQAQAAANVSSATGVTFVVASDAAILVADRSHQGAEHLKEGFKAHRSLPWDTMATVTKDLVIYSSIGLFRCRI